MAIDYQIEVKAVKQLAGRAGGGKRPVKPDDPDAVESSWLFTGLHPVDGSVIGVSVQESDPSKRESDTPSRSITNEVQRLMNAYVKEFPDGDPGDPPTRRKSPG